MRFQWGLAGALAMALGAAAAGCDQDIETDTEEVGTAQEAVGSPSLTVDKTLYLTGEPITVTFANGPGNSTDWIGIYPANILPGQTASTLWYYVNGSKTAGRRLRNGTIVFEAGSGSWPLPPGSWHAYFLRKDGYTVLASANFSVVATSDPPLVNGGLGDPSSAITHVITVMLENHSFDALFGRYCTAAAGSDPSCNDGPACCEAAPPTEPGPLHSAPVALTDSTNGNYDPPHGSTCIQAAVDGGSMDGYVVSSVSGCGNVRNFALATPPEMNIYWNLASQYAIGDRYFHSYAGASFANDMFFARAGWVFNDNAYVPPTLGQSCTGGTPHTYTDPTIAGLLVAAGVSWGVYIEGYQSMLSTVGAGNTCPAPPADCPAQSTRYPCTYSPPDIPFAYYPALHMDAGPARDYSLLATHLANGTLPAVSWVRPLGYKTQHPGSGTTLTAGAAFVQSLLDAVLASPYANTTLVLVTYDESGGYFDHVSPPANSAIDGKPYGPRVPMLALGYFARQGFVSHVTMEHSSIVKFIEWNWLGGTTGQLGTRDTVVNNLGSLLDPVRTGTPVPE